jgi:type I restriction enzyme M protein
METRIGNKKPFTRPLFFESSKKTTRPSSLGYLTHPRTRVGGGPRNFSAFSYFSSKQKCLVDSTPPNGQGEFPPIKAKHISTPRSFRVFSLKPKRLRGVNVGWFEKNLFTPPFILKPRGVNVGWFERNLFTPPFILKPRGVRAMSEKRREVMLSESLRNFDDEYIFFSPSEHPDLVEFFKGCSKVPPKVGKERGQGIPDRIFYNGKVLIIFEIKWKNLEQAIKDAILYLDGTLLNLKRLNRSDIEVYAVAYVNTTEYTIFDSDSQKIDKQLSPGVFKLEEILTKNKVILDIKKEIHDLHNYIRGHSFILDEDKTFFVAAILVALKEDTFKSVVNLLSDKTKVYQQLDIALKLQNISLPMLHTVFKQDSNKNVLLNIIQKIAHICDNTSDRDILNDFYSEFVSYYNTNSSSFGIVLTPPNIVSLMVNMLEIKKDDVILDLCAGTGSFLLESQVYSPKKLIGCESQPKLYTLIECNMLLRDLKPEQYSIKLNDCFEENFEATKSVINPPFGLKTKSELDFVLKQIKSVKKGLCVSIFPISCVSENKRCRKLKKEIMEKSTVKTIIQLKNDVFLNDIAVVCCIMLLDTSRPHSPSDDVLFIDYREDFISKEKNLEKTTILQIESALKNIQFIVKNRTTTDISFLTKLKVTDEWLYGNENLKPKPIKPSISLDIKDFKKKKEIFLSNIDPEEKKPNSKIELKTIIKEFPIREIFEIESVKKSITLKSAKEKPGDIPFISASAYKNGITCFTGEHPTSVLISENCLTLAKNGSVGSTFYQSKKFYASTDILVLRLKEKKNQKNINLYIFLCYVLTEQLKERYDYGRKLNLTKLDGENPVTILLPSKNGEINYDFMIDFSPDEIGALSLLND